MAGEQIAIRATGVDRGGALGHAPLGAFCDSLALSNLERAYRENLVGGRTKSPFEKSFQ